jgi:hypothetical protein
MTRKRSTYRPRPVIKDPLTYVLSGFKRITQEHQTIVALRHHDALHALTHGTASKEDWETVCSMINTSVAMSEKVFSGEYLEELKAAMTAHAKCGRRFVEGKGMGYTGAELEAVNTAVDLITEQLKLVTVAELEDSVRAVEQAIRDKNFFASIKEVAM